MKYFIKLSLSVLLYFTFHISISVSAIVEEFRISGNDRISKETIILFSKVNIKEEVNANDLNDIIKTLYKTNFFNNISVKFENNVLYIDVIEFPLIQSVMYKGVKSKKIINLIKNSIILKDRTSFRESGLLKDKNIISNILKNQGYYFSKISTSVKDLDNNKVNLIYNIDLGDKAKIKKISFIGDKIYKNAKLRSIILSEEYKFWKIISGKKYLNQQLVEFDAKLLKNFYLNKGYYNVKINTSLAKLISENEFELIYNIQPNTRIFFNKLDLNFSNDYEKDNFKKIFKLFDDLKGQPYSINSIDQVLDLIDEIVVNKQYEAIKATVEENIIGNKIDLLFNIKETEKFFVEKININGNNITDEKVIRNQLEIDEGDPFNEILHNKSINNLKSLNFFKTVVSNIYPSSNENNKIIEINVEERPTGEIMAGAGVGTSGSTVMFGIKENNFLGKGVGISSNITLTEDTIKGLFHVNNPNFKNSDKSVYYTLESSETDLLETSGYKNSKNGFKFGTSFEIYNDFNFGIGLSNYYEKISTNSTASALQQKQEGNYWDSFLKLDFIQDKRNQKFKTSKGYLSSYNLDIPIISDTNSLINTYSYKYYSELYTENITSLGFTASSAFSINNNDIKLSERLFIPSSKLRGFEIGKVGPKDGNDYIGGNYMATVNFTTTLPQVLPNSQNLETVFFIDIANLWGVDYNSSIDSESKIKSSLGIGLNFFSPIGPMTFSFAQPITKDTNDLTETFRFNIGTSF